MTGASSGSASGGAAAPAAARAVGGQRVLIGHPRPPAVTVLRAALNSVGVRVVDVALDAEGVLAMVGRGAPDLLVLHLGLLSDGLDLIARLRALDGMRDAPILVLGRFSGAGERQALMRAGATDLIPRPVTRPELAARLRVHLENRSLNRSLQEVIRSLQSYHSGAVQRMTLARDMQLDLLPTADERGGLERRYAIRLDSHFESSSELGGDIWGARALDDHRFAVFLCDFTGHGVAAALNTFRLHALLSKIDLPGDDPAETLGAINGLLVGLLPETQFATMLYAVIDVQAGAVVYATAGAPKPLVGRPDGVLEVGASLGLPLGVSPKASYRNRRLDFPPGSFLFLFSDALFEARDWDGQVFGYQGVVDLVNGLDSDAEIEGGPLRQLLERYFTTMPRPLADDLTALWISRRAVLPPGDGPD